MSNENIPPGPRKPPGSGAKMSRRSFFRRLSLFLGGLGTAILAVPMIGFIFDPLFREEPPVWRTVGRTDSFRIGQTVAVTYLDPSPLPWAGVTANNAAWLRRESETEFIAFTVNCTHLGCPVRWMPDANLFMCPCHGGVYYSNGQVAAGPPPKPLPRYPTRVVGGLVQIQTRPITIA